ncbi:MAG: heavy-metal-associated domain-containing protein [Phycisphaerae bacterium]
MKSIAIDIQGMHCEACVERVRQALAGLAGVSEVQVSVGQVRLTIDETQCRVGRVVSAVRGLEGFEVVSFQATPSG